MAGVIETGPAEASSAPRGRFAPRLAGALAGIIAAAVALGIAEVVAAAVGPRSSPVIAVGASLVDGTPRPVKDFAIHTFGTHDKLVLLIGVYVLLTAFAALIGLLALRREVYGLLGIAVFGLIGVVAAGSRPYASMLDALPSIVGAGGGAIALTGLGKALPRPARRIRKADPPTRDNPTPALMSAPTGFDRRRFLVTGGIYLGVAVVAGGVGRALLQRFDVSAARDALRLPRPASPAPALPAGAELRVTDLTPFHTPNPDFYRVDTVLTLPQVKPGTWKLRIHGRVENPLTLTLDDLLRRDLIERDVTLACVSNEIGGNLAGNARWLGVPLKPLLDEVQPQRGADQIVSRSSDGFTCGTPTALCRDGRDAMLAVGMNGEPLPVTHGFPVRMIVPGLYGYVSATKWIVDMELSSFADFDAYWVREGWAQQAPIKTFSRIDTPGSASDLSRGTVTVAGVAWAQHRGIDKVEVRVNKGSWQTARLATEATTDTWRQWLWRWHVDKRGDYTIECRATDRTGATQTDTRQAPFPDGATGWHSVVVTVH